MNDLRALVERRAAARARRALEEWRRGARLPDEEDPGSISARTLELGGAPPRWARWLTLEAIGARLRRSDAYLRLAAEAGVVDRADGVLASLDDRAAREAYWRALGAVLRALEPRFIAAERALSEAASAVGVASPRALAALQVGGDLEAVVALAERTLRATAARYQASRHELAAETRAELAYVTGRELPFGLDLASARALAGELPVELAPDDGRPRPPRMLIVDGEVVLGVAPGGTASRRRMVAEAARAAFWRRRGLTPLAERAPLGEDVLGDAAAAGADAARGLPPAEARLEAQVAELTRLATLRHAAAAVLLEDDLLRGLPPGEASARIWRALGTAADDGETWRRDRLGLGAAATTLAAGVLATAPLRFVEPPSPAEAATVLLRA